MSIRCRGLLVSAALLAGLAIPVHSAHAAAEPSAQCTAENPVLIPTPPPALSSLNAGQANTLATGKGVVVAVVDSGVDRQNPHLRGATVLPGRSFVDGDKDPRGWTDVYGHGTAIAGIVAARPVESSGLVGLAPQSRILPVRVYVGTEPGPQVAPADVPRVDRMAAGIRWAASKGADVINVSLSAPAADPALVEAVQFAIRKGALVVASGGNRVDQGATEPTPEIPNGARYPAALEGVLGVTAADASGLVTDDSVHGPHVDVAAPGQNVLAPFFGGNCVLAADAPSTSFATAYASAAAALLKEAFPDASIQELSRRLEETASLAARGSRDDVSGWGVIRPQAALSVALSEKPLATEQVAPRAFEDGVALVTSAVSAPDPRTDSRRAAAWWAAGGVAGLLLVLLLGGVVRGPRRPSIGGGSGI